MTHLRNFPTRYNNEPAPNGDEWITAAKRALASLRKGGIVILYGKRGTGKTRMAWEIAQCSGFPRETAGQWNTRLPAIYYTAVDFIAEIRASLRADSRRSDLDLREELSGSALLVLDELQEGIVTDFDHRQITSIVDARYRQERPTLLIANYEGPEQIAASLSPSILSRMQECGGCIPCDWPSYRGKVVKP